MLTSLIALALMPGGSIAETAEIVVDATRREPISPYIYGVNYPDTQITDWLRDWASFHDGFTLAREGGNRFTAYNWETNASNAGKDYFFENDDYLGVTNESGWTVSTFLKTVQPTGAAVLLTVPTLGYVAADKGPNDATHKDVNLTPDYLHKRFVPSYPTDTGDTSAPHHAVYQDQFVAWVEKVKSNATPVWFSLDNEPDFWPMTHARIAPKPWTYAQIITNNIAYAAAIKGAAPETKVFGPVNYGWYGFRAFQGASDANGRIFVDAYLDAMHEAATKAGHRLLDVYDFHWYPEAMGGGVRIIYNQAPDNAETEEARIQSPRSLWDPTYVETSWITKSLGGKAIRLLPDFHERIAAHYPGTKIAITEYEFGARDKISGALAQADALGVFGRYGLFAACHWGLNAGEHAAMAAFEAFTDFDRHGSRFGDLGLAVSGEVPASDSIYASLDSKQKGRMTLVIINKTKAPKPFRVSIRGFGGKSARGYVVRDGVYDTPESVSPNLTAGSLSYEAPGRSITTLEIRD